jgi:hypothetical protein
MPRFVILRHELPGDAQRALHWDLMFESGGVLRTWSVLVEPGFGIEAAAEPLALHRLAYLDYEGPISGGRGSVSRWDAGEYDLLAASDQRWQARVRGARFCGTITLERAIGNAHSWRVSFGAAPTRS